MTIASNKACFDKAWKTGWLSVTSAESIRQRGRCSFILQSQFGTTATWFRNSIGITHHPADAAPAYICSSQSGGSCTKVMASKEPILYVVLSTEVAQPSPKQGSIRLNQKCGAKSRYGVLASRDPPKNDSGSSGSNACHADRSVGLKWRMSPMHMPPSSSSERVIVTSPAGVSEEFAHACIQGSSPLA